MISKLLRRFRKANDAPAPLPRIKNKWLDLEYDEVPLRGKTMRFATTGSSSRKRLRTLFTKEPITLAWIDTFGEGETLYDIGANVGMYTVYAAVMRNSQVYAFEPEALNYAELNKNIFLNDLDKRVLGYCLALSDVDKADRLLLSDFGIGISYHDFQENSWTEDKAFAPDWVVSKDGRRQQGCIGRTVDSLIEEGMPVPHHIKIDVDGLEHRVIRGMAELLRHPQLKTVLVEINYDNPRNLEIVDRMQEGGWRFSWCQLGMNRKHKFDVEGIKAFQRRRAGGFNYIFYKDDRLDAVFQQAYDAYVPGQPIDLRMPATP
ncbi:FkbM family methyltransferase [Sphingomonas piscis]|uniref:FkbM family methyltransferase n=1 Tax=Sphingomonas piscis TaxID=2714943 RepID=A0A6G7YQD8_9SPHN|nr:FkbM family methyltransferase [Sphingomonas piscis]QIK78946.1 FkbM family methyltransferase [Sphingomonas piscis]